MAKIHVPAMSGSSILVEHKKTYYFSTSTQTVKVLNLSDRMATKQTIINSFDKPHPPSLYSPRQWWSQRDKIVSAITTCGRHDRGENQFLRRVKNSKNKLRKKRRKQTTMMFAAVRGYYFLNNVQKRKYRMRRKRFTYLSIMQWGCCWIGTRREP